MLTTGLTILLSGAFPKIFNPMYSFYKPSLSAIRSAGAVLTALFLFTAPFSKSYGQNIDDSIAKQFITKMYNDKLYEDYDFLQEHCSQALLTKLQDAYPYDSDDVAYATWLFRSGQQDSNPDAEDKTILLGVTCKNGWYTYTALDMGWKFSRQIKLVLKDDKIIIDDLKM